MPKKSTLPTYLEQTSRHWSESEESFVGRGVSWLELLPIQKRLNFKISDSGLDWISYTLEQHLSGRVPVKNCLSLGCGRGDLERDLARRNVFLKCDAVDIAESSIEIARKRALAEGFRNINYRVQNLNSIELEEQQYDIVWAHEAVHHIENLEHVFAQIGRALKADGLFVLHEYVGPSRFQFSPRRKEIIQTCFLLLPEQYRRIVPEVINSEVGRNPLRNGLKWAVQRTKDKIMDGTLLRAIQRRLQVVFRSYLRKPISYSAKTPPTASDVIAADPSEAIRSSDIVGVLSSYFDIVERKPLGGSILQFLLDGIAGNFKADDPQDMEWLRLLFTIEDSLLETGEIDSDFAYIVARAKKNHD